MKDFELFWKEYPRKIGKGAARRAFAKAIKLTDMETILNAIAEYKRHKPDHVDFCHPSTWLNQERWEDEWDTATNDISDELAERVKETRRLRAGFKVVK